MEFLPSNLNIFMNCVDDHKIKKSIPKSQFELGISQNFIDALINQDIYIDLAEIDTWIADAPKN